MLSRLLLASVVTAAMLASANGDDPPVTIAKFFKPPAELATDLGNYRSPLKLDDGSTVKNAADWQKRRGEILKYWHSEMGEWPALIEKPKVELGPKEQREGITQHSLKIETAPGRTVDDAYLLIPEGKGPFPAVVVVFYDAKTGVGLGKSPMRDFALQLAKRGFVALSLGGDPNTYYPTKATCKIQPLSFHAYEAANCYNALASMPNVDPKRIGVVGHSYGGKWSMFAGALYDKFACAATSDPGIMFDEKRSNVNYWEPWYLGFDPALETQRKAGIPNEKNPRTGPYKKMMAEGRDLHELHALMAPRPFFVSGGSEDHIERWKALNHTVAVNKLLGFENRVGLTTRPEHNPSVESNAALFAFFEWALQAGKVGPGFAACGVALPIATPQAANNFGNHRSHIAQLHGLFQPRERVTRRNEFLPDVARVADVDQLLHDRGIVHFLILVEFATSGNACRVNVPDDVLVLLDAADDVAVHELHVVDVEQQLDPRRTHFAKDRRHEIEVVALIAGVPLHRVGTVSRVQMLDAHRHALLLGVLREFLQPLHAVRERVVGRDRSRLRVLGVSPLVTHERDDARELGVGTGVDHLAGAFEILRVECRVVEASHERCSGHSVRCDRADETVLLESRPVFRPDDFDGRAPEVGSHFAGLLGGPLVAAGVEAPEHDGLLDAALEFLVLSSGN